MEQTARPRIGFIGTGIMGGHMARRLAQAGFSTTVWNRTATKAAPLTAAGATLVASPSAAMAEADIVIVMLSTGPVIDAVLFERDASGQVPTEALRPGATLIVMSSIPVETCRAQAQRLQGRGVAYIDAPVSGGEFGARDGTLAIMAGGDEAAIDAVRPALAPLGRVTRIGPVGTGQLTKLANQIIVGGTLAAVAEALHFASAGGADIAAVRMALSGGFGDSTILRQHGERMVKQDFTPGSPAAYQLKDLRTAGAQADAMGVHLTLFQTVLGLFSDMVEHGDGTLDVAAIIREVARRATTPAAEAR